MPNLLQSVMWRCLVWRAKCALGACLFRNRRAWGAAWTRVADGSAEGAWSGAALWFAPYFLISMLAMPFGADRAGNGRPIEGRSNGTGHADTGLRPHASPVVVKKHVYVFEGLGGYSGQVLQRARAGDPVDYTMNGNISSPFALVDLVQNSIDGMPHVTWDYYPQDENIGLLVARVVAAQRRGVELAATGGPAARSEQIVVVGFSNGADAAIEFTRELGEHGIKVALGITVDPVPKGVAFFPHYVKPANSGLWLNYYQKYGGTLFIVGHSMDGADNVNQDRTADVQAEMEKYYDLSKWLPFAVGGHLYISRLCGIRNEIEVAIGTLPAPPGDRRVVSLAEGLAAPAAAGRHVVKAQGR